MSPTGLNSRLPTRTPSRWITTPCRPARAISCKTHTTQAETGNPLNPTVSINPGVSLTVRPDVRGPIQVTGDPAAWFGSKTVFAAEFATPCVAAIPPATLPTCHPGNLGRDSITGPG